MHKGLVVLTRDTETKLDHSPKWVKGKGMLGATDFPEEIGRGAGFTTKSEENPVRRGRDGVCEIHQIQAPHGDSLTITANLSTAYKQNET